MASRGWEGILPREDEDSGLEDSAAIDPGGFSDDEPATVVADVRAFNFAEKTSPQAKVPDVRDVLDDAPGADPDEAPARARPAGRPRVAKERRPAEEVARAGPSATPDLSSDLEPPAVSPVGRKLRLPLPGEVKSTSSPNLPALEPSAAAEPAALPARPLSVGARSPGVPESPRLSSSELMEKLAGPADKGARKTSFYAEYKEVVHAVLIGIVLLGGVVAYEVTHPDPEEPSSAPRVLRPPPAPATQPSGTAAGPAPTIAGTTPASAGTTPASAGTTPAAPGTTPTPPGTTPAGSAPKAESTVPQNATAGTAAGAKESARPARSATPMLTVVSSPPGASVEINGELFGNTPLIRPGPANIQKLSIRLHLNNYKKWEQVIALNAAGHFTVNAKLEPVPGAK